MHACESVSVYVFIRVQVCEDLFINAHVSAAAGMRAQTAKFGVDCDRGRGVRGCLVDQHHF